MRDPDRALGLVHVLPAGARGAITRRRAGRTRPPRTSTSSASGSTATVTVEVWMRPWLSVAGTRWTRCTPEFVFQPGEHVAAGDLGDALLQPAELGVVVFQDLEAPAARVGVSLVHREQLGGEQPRLVAARGGTDFQDGGTLVGLVARQQRQSDLVLQSRDALLERRAARPRRARASPGRRAAPRPRPGRARRRAARRCARRPARCRTAPCEARE